MVDGTRREISSSIEETLAQLDQLNRQDLARKADLRAKLQAVVDASTVVLPSDDGGTGAPVARQGERPADRSPSAPDRRPFIPRKPGYDHGPKVAEKIYREAVEKGGWW